MQTIDEAEKHRLFTQVLINENQRCPDGEAISSYVLEPGSLRAYELKEVEGHIVSCMRCKRNVELIRRDAELLQNAWRTS